MIYIIFAIIMFSLLIAVHEFGHFFVAKLCGVRVNEFAIGMGPQLLKKQGKETMYSLRAFPIGGFCAMEGEDEDSEDPRAFGNAAAWKRLLILIAGSGMNLLTGFVILICLYLPNQSMITTQISGFMDGCPAAEEGYLQAGDEILKIDGHRVSLYSDIPLLLSQGNGETVDLVVRRDGARIAMENVPIYMREYNEDGQQVVRYGLYFAAKETNVLDDAALAMKTGGYFVRLVWFSLEDLVTGGVRLSDLSGPIGIVSTMSQVGEAAYSWVDALENLLYFAAFIAINLAVMNLLPLPALDGGRVLFLLLNGISTLVLRRSIPEKYERYVHLAGMGLLLALMAVVAVSDVLKIVGGG